MTTKNVGQPCVICGQRADAQATIAALQARVRELEQWVQDQSTANLEMMRHTDEMQSRALEAEQQLTQRTAELEATEKAYQDKTRLYIEQTGAVADLQAELERVRGELQSAEAGYFVAERELQGANNKYDELHTLIAALPKVEGEIEVSSGVYNFILLKHDSGTRFLCGQIETEQTAKAYAALLQHRQGMEG